MTKDLEVDREILGDRLVQIITDLPQHKRPSWLRGARKSTASEHTAGYTAVIETMLPSGHDGFDLPLRIAVSKKDFDEYNYFYPHNGQLLILLFPDYSDARILNKGMFFIEREYYK